MAIPILVVKNNLVYDDKDKRIGVVISATPKCTPSPKIKLNVDGKDVEIQPAPVMEITFTVIFDPVEMEKTNDRVDLSVVSNRKIKV
jgi:hypothetical protein